MKYLRRQCDWGRRADEARLFTDVHRWDWCSLDSSAAGERKMNVCVRLYKQHVKSVQMALWEKKN